MAPLLLAASGALALGVAVAILRGFGPRYRVGRLLAAAPQASLAEALRLAEAGDEEYLRVEGRIDSDAEFEDDRHQPLVLRRTTLRWRPSGGGPWTSFDSATQAVRFVLREGLDEIEVDPAALAEGLIVVPRVRRGRVGDVTEHPPAEVPADADAELVIEQVSSVERATMVGVPRRTKDGRLSIGPGLGRPLILTTLERDEAMRVLTGGAAGRSRLAVVCLVGGAILIIAAVLWWLADALLGTGVPLAAAASPDPSLRPGSDTRSSGQGPGLVGEPLLAILGMLGIGIVSVAASLAYVRLTGGRGGSETRHGGSQAPPR